MSLDRRTFILGAAAALVLPRGVSGARPRFDRYPFSLGVASGDPLADGVILWTRLAPEPLQGGGMPPIPVGLEWDVAADESFRRIVRTGTATARPERAHTVHVDVRGLEPDRSYWYRFRVRGAGGALESPIGRTRTAPLPDADLREIRIGYASCQKYEDGYFTAYRHLSDEDLHLVLFLGDYIYEGAAVPGMPRPHPKDEAMTLADYRHRYALYQSDADLQLAHRSFPWMVVWDDHELFNDYAGEVVRRQRGFRERQQAAYQAFTEHMPVRAKRPVSGNAVQLYRGVALGRLANLRMLDTRQYRSPHACGEGVQHPCAALDDERRTVLGAAQERWLFDSIRASQARWQIIAQQIPFAVVDREPGPGISYSTDKWDGYPAARGRILGFLAARGRRDTVVLTGDNHNHWVMELSRAADGERGLPIATEFVGSSISSAGDGAEQRDVYADVLSDNPHARYLNSRRGYVRCTVTPTEWRTDFRVVPYVSRPDAPVSTNASFVLTHGEARVERV